VDLTKPQISKAIVAVWGIFPGRAVRIVSGLPCS
jgi:hypothetical protein